MQNKKFLIFTCIIILSANLFAVQNVAGQKYYLKQCSSCHGKGNRGGGLAASYEWKEYFENSAKELISFHHDEPKSLKYLNSEKFQKQKKKILNFLLEFASDSQTIPSCNN
jgi:hypothetical protein